MWPFLFFLLWLAPCIAPVAAQNPTMNLPSGAAYTYFSLAATATTPVAQTSNNQITGQITNTAYNSIQYRTTAIPCQQPFAGGVDPNVNNGRLEADYGALPLFQLVTGSSAAMWVFLADYDFPSAAQEFFARDIATSPSNALDFRVGMLRSSLANGVFDQFCLGQGVSATAGAPNSPPAVCLAGGAVPLQTWTHVGVKMSRDSSFVPRIYLNGVFQTPAFTTGGFINGPSFTSASSGFFIGKSWNNLNPLNGHLRNLVTSSGIFSDADFAYLGNRANVVNTAVACDPNTYCPAKGNTIARCYPLRK